MIFTGSEVTFRLLLQLMSIQYIHKLNIIKKTISPRIILFQKASSDLLYLDNAKVNIFMVFDGLNSTSKKENYLYKKFYQGKRVSDNIIRDFGIIKAQNCAANKNKIEFGPTTASKISTWYIWYVHSK